MVSAISSVNQHIPNLEDLEIIRRLQSLGLNPTGNKSYDRQRLQAAEIQKQQYTLSSNSEPALNKLEGTGRDFSTMLSVVQETQPPHSNNIRNDQNGLINFPPPKQKPDVPDVAIGREMIGATQLAELNKLKLGLIA